MTLLSALVVLLVLGGIAWAIRMSPIDQPWRNLAFLALLIALLVIVVRSFPPAASVLNTRLW